MRRHTGRPPVEPEELKQTLSLVGGRLSYLNKVGPILRTLQSTFKRAKYQVSKSKDMIGMAKHLLEVEKAWLLSQIGEYWQTKFPFHRTHFSHRRSHT
jgi:AAA+ ATPase superfamily predicted ATPase